MAETRILLGVIGRAHGVRGLVRVTSHTEDPADLTAYGPLSDDRGRRFTLSWRGEGIVEVAELVGGTPVKVTDRTQAETLTNTRLYVDRAQLPPPEDADEFYLADLIGLAALGVDGAELGRVAVVHDYGAGVSLEIETVGRTPLIVPFTRDCVPVVDVAAGRITVVPPDEVVAEPPATEVDLSPSSSSGLTRGSPTTPGLGVRSDPRVKQEDNEGGAPTTPPRPTCRQEVPA